MLLPTTATYGGLGGTNGRNRNRPCVVPRPSVRPSVRPCEASSSKGPRGTRSADTPLHADMLPAKVRHRVDGTRALALSNITPPEVRGLTRLDPQGVDGCRQFTMRI